MTKLIIQIPCYNEADSLARTFAALPKHMDGVDEIEIVVIDDGSHDGTADVARQLGAHYIARHAGNRGLAAAFQTGLDLSLSMGADIIVNTDADGQYAGEDIIHLAQPILDGSADIVIGDRGVINNEHFGPVKQRLQKMGSKIVQSLARTDVPDAVSGFRAISRDAARRICITTDFSYTTDMLIQAGRKRMAITSVPVRTNATLRPSRLFRNIPQFIINTGMTILRVYSRYNPLRVFTLFGLAMVVAGLLPIGRFFVLYLLGTAGGHLQSLIIGGALVLLGALTILLGLLADLIGTNRRLLEITVEKVRRLEEQLDRAIAAGKSDK